mmetsp:Transcript_400/g.1216  ORF Transcript_400/g.1216 Transcript_400/m.1216 type:complete len:228 (+) Transcript_400:1150-1833(+)
MRASSAVVATARTKSSAFPAPPSPSKRSIRDRHAARTSGSATSSNQKECRCDRHIIRSVPGTGFRVVKSRKPCFSAGRCPPAPRPPLVGASKPLRRKWRRPSWLTMTLSKGRAPAPRPISWSVRSVPKEQPRGTSRMPSSPALADGCWASGTCMGTAAGAGTDAAAPGSGSSSGPPGEASKAFKPPRPCKPQCVSSAQAWIFAMSTNRMASMGLPMIQSSAQRTGLQ